MFRLKPFTFDTLLSGGVFAREGRLRSVCDDTSFWTIFLQISEEPQPVTDHPADFDDQCEKIILKKKKPLKILFQVEIVGVFAREGRLWSVCAEKE